MNIERVEQRIKGYYPGWKNKSVKTLKEVEEKQLEKIKDAKNTMNENKKKLDVITHKYGAMSEESLQARKEYNKSCDYFEEQQKLLTTGDVFTDYSIKDFEYTPNEIFFSLAEINGRKPVDEANRLNMVVDTYNNVLCAEEVKEGEAPSGTDLADSLVFIKTDNTESIIFDDITRVGEGTKEDDSKNIEMATTHVHNVHFVNAENKKGFEIIMKSKEALSFTADTVKDKINANLCAKAKSKAMIIVNKTGFAKLDTDDSNGRAIVKKDQSGDFIYKDKYVIKEVSDEILPNSESGSTPIIVGDMSVLNYFVLREDYLEKTDIMAFKVSDRGIRKEIITLSTNSDEAYIWGYLG